MRVRMLLADDQRLFMRGLSRLLVLTCEVRRMVTNGRASAYALRQASAEQTYAAITAASCERKYLSASFPINLVMILAEAVRRPYREEAELTCRQRELLQLVAEGKAMKKATSLLNLSTRTVESYQHEIMNALCTAMRNFVQYAMRVEVITVTPNAFFAA